MEIVESILPLDRISDLPGNVADTILMCLPTRDVVRTSILSSKWRYAWTRLPHFVFDETMCSNVAGKHSARNAHILIQLLLRHEGPIKKIKLSNSQLSSCPEIDNLIFFLTKTQIEDFTLEMSKDCYSMPYCFFSCKKLRHLKLKLCSIRSSPAYQGFSRLTSLVLVEVTISDETLASLISCSPLLGLLDLSISSGTDICIDAPNLKTFIFYGYTESINFKRVPVLSSVSIKQNDSKKTTNFVGVGHDTVKFFQRLLVIESLELSYRILLSFVDILQKILPCPLIYLKDLKLHQISFSDMTDLSFTLCLLTSSPNLEFIYILFLDYPDSDPENSTVYMKGEDYFDIRLNHLQKVKLEGFTGTKPELEFTRIILDKSSSLKKIEIQPKDGAVDNGFKIFKELLRFRRMSREAEILFE